MKNRCDVQEAQLNLGMLPSDEGFGIELDSSEGKLVTIDLDNNKKTEFLASSKGNYNGLFDALYDTVRDDKPYPITEEQIIWQLEILET